MNTWNGEKMEYGRAGDRMIKSARLISRWIEIYEKDNSFRCEGECDKLADAVKILFETELITQKDYDVALAKLETSKARFNKWIETTHNT